jgi:Flp pilus assembly protein TadG
MAHYERARRGGRRGTALIEFTLVSLMLSMLVLTTVEIDRMLLVYTAIADSTRAGLRYAIVNGSTVSGRLATDAQIRTVIQNFAQTGILDKTKLDSSHVTITRGTCPRGSDAGSGCSVTNTAPGATIAIKTIYPYDPFTSYFPLSVNIGSTSEGYIVF